MKLKTKNNVNRNLKFRIYELHVVLACLKSLEKYINMKTLDHLHIKTDIYCHLAVKIIK